MIQEKKRKTYSKSNLNLRDKGSESLRTDARNCFYPFFIKDEKIIGIGEVSSDDFHPRAQTVRRKGGIYEVWPIDVGGIERKWRYARQSIEDISDILKTKKTDSGYEIEIYKEYEKYKTVWNEPEYNSSLYGTKILHEILPECNFNFPKSLYLVRECLYSLIANNKNAIALDFFAGSGTTGHAVLALNQEDGGKRQFILCTNNENNICSDVCYPRIQKVMEGYKNLEGENVAGLGGNLKYYRTAFVPAAPTDKNKELLTKQSIEMLTLKEGAFTIVTENPSYVIYRNSDRYTGIIFDQLSFDEFKEAVEEIDKPISLYIFSLADEDFSDDFADMRGLIKICAIPESILRVYRRIFR